MLLAGQDTGDPCCSRLARVLRYQHRADAFRTHTAVAVRDTCLRVAAVRMQMLPNAGQAGAMSERRVIVFPPSGTGGRQVDVDGEILGTAYSLHDLTVFLRNAGLPNWDEVDVAESGLIEWHGGGPEVWKA